MNKKKYSLEYRSNGRWYPLGTFRTREEAKKEAERSWSCRSGYQIRKLK